MLRLFFSDCRMDSCLKLMLLFLFYQSRYLTQNRIQYQFYIHVRCSVSTPTLATFIMIIYNSFFCCKTACITSCARSLPTINKSNHFMISTIALYSVFSLSFNFLNQAASSSSALTLTVIFFSLMKNNKVVVTINNINLHSLLVIWQQTHIF